MFKPTQICRNYLPDWVLLIIHGNYWVKDSLLRFRTWSHLQLAGGGCFWNWRTKKGAVAAGLSSRRPPRRWMKPQIVFNQIPGLADRQRTATQRAQEQEQCLLNILPAGFLSATNETCRFLQADLVRTLPVLMIYACHGRKRPEAEFGSAQGLLSFHLFSLGCMEAKGPLFHNYSSLEFGKCLMVWKSVNIFCSSEDRPTLTHGIHLCLSLI